MSNTKIELMDSLEAENYGEMEELREVDEYREYQDEEIKELNSR